MVKNRIPQTVGLSLPNCCMVFVTHILASINLDASKQTYKRVVPVHVMQKSVLQSNVALEMADSTTSGVSCSQKTAERHSVVSSCGCSFG